MPDLTASAATVKEGLSAAGSVCGCLSRLRVRRREPGALTLPTPSSIPPDYATQEGETRFNAAQRLFDTTRLAAVSCYFPETVMKLSGTAGVRGVIIKRGQHVRNWIGHCDFPLKESDRSCLEPGWNLDETPYQVRARHGCSCSLCRT